MGPTYFERRAMFMCPMPGARVRFVRDLAELNAGYFKTPAYVAANPQEEDVFPPLFCIDIALCWHDRLREYYAGSVADSPPSQRYRAMLQIWFREGDRIIQNLARKDAAATLDMERKTAFWSSKMGLPTQTCANHCECFGGTKPHPQLQVAASSTALAPLPPFQHADLVKEIVASAKDIKKYWTSLDTDGRCRWADLDESDVFQLTCSQPQWELIRNVMVKLGQMEGEAEDAEPTALDFNVRVPVDIASFQLVPLLILLRSLRCCSFIDGPCNVFILPTWFP